MKKIVTIIFLFLFVKISAGQTNNVLSKQQMLEDYDFLIDKIEQISPHIEPKKQLWDYDILQQIKTRKQEIDTISSYNSFWSLVYRALQTCQDGHTQIETENADFNKRYNDFNLYLPFKYINGEYYAVKPFTYKGVFFPFGTKVLQFNGQNIHSYMQTITQYRYFMQWDLVNKRFYFDYGFYATDNIAIAKQFSLTLKKPDQTISSIDFETSDTVALQPSKTDYSSSKKVEYWHEQKTLYIRVPEMDKDDVEFYKNQIVATATSTQIEKIIIDIRNNFGGSDDVWKAIYSSIISKPYSYYIKLCGNKPDFMDKAYMRKKGLKKNKMKTEKISFLDNKMFYIYYEGIEKIKPHRESIRFDGKIIVIGNENIYSSAGSCMELPNADSTDNIISVGRPTGTFLGGGYDPITCTLPHSKIQFYIEPVIDLTNVNTVQDIMHNTYEYTIPITLEEYKQKFDYNGNIWNKEYLVKYDPFIKKALEL